jgi:excinuclease ABC subunit C
MASRLDAIPGIGPARRKALLTTFGSIDKIEKASVEELSQVNGINTDLAHMIKSHLE